MDWWICVAPKLMISDHDELEALRSLRFSHHPVIRYLRIYTPLPPGTKIEAKVSTEGEPEPLDLTFRKTSRSQ